MIVEDGGHDRRKRVAYREEVRRSSMKTAAACVSLRYGMLNNMTKSCLVLVRRVRRGIMDRFTGINLKKDSS